jgi:hypothetical protein
MRQGARAGPNIIIAFTLFNILAGYAFALRGRWPRATDAPVDLSL